ncbi:MAG: 2-amino-4-hydroxy-6-hydroxymethyldihydropteridine diphosphokinase [Gammaproteobacteria bacterium]|nr:2-amino-4-hydroxy-6-hydroxymethyldihydropteridine diphosphokinase [Gammaproteobacteria bacterium]
MISTIISVGSNIDPLKNCEASREILQTETNFRARSEYIMTKPWGYEDQADFLNGAFWLETELDYAGFNAYLKEVEKRMDRIDHGDKTGPRTIDLDIIVWDNAIIEDDFYSKDYVRIPVTDLIESHSLKIRGYPEPDLCDSQ